MQSEGKRRGKSHSGHSITNYLLSLELKQRKMSVWNSSTPLQQPSYKECEYNPPLSKADLDASLSAIYDKLANKIQHELHKSTNALTQEIANIGSRTDILETKHDELSLAHSDLRRDY